MHQNMFSMSYSISARANRSPESFQESDFQLAYVFSKARPETLKNTPKTEFRRAVNSSP